MPFVRGSLYAARPDGAPLLVARRRVEPGAGALFLVDDLGAAEAEPSVSSTACTARELVATSRRWRMIASGPTSLGLTKALIHRSLTVDLATSLELEAFYQAANARTEDAREGLMSFVERRAPSFKGR